PIGAARPALYTLSLPAALPILALATAPDFLSVPPRAPFTLPASESFTLPAAGGGFARPHRHLLPLPTAPPSLGLDRSRDRQKNAPTRARALLRAWVRMNGGVEGS